MSDYSNDFEEANNADAPYKLKLSVDVRTAQNFNLSANVFVKFAVQLSDKFHQFRSEQPSAIRQGPSESKLQGSFASYEFFANKPELGSIMNNNAVDITLLHSDGQREVGSVRVPLKMLQEGE